LDAALVHEKAFRDLGFGFFYLVVRHLRQKLNIINFF